jgi:hypothetical protein
MTASDPALSAQSRVFVRLCDARKSPWHSACRCGRRCAAHGQAARFEPAVCGADRYGGFDRRLPQRAEHRAVLRANSSTDRLRSLATTAPARRSPPRYWAHPGHWRRPGVLGRAFPTPARAERTSPQPRPSIWRYRRPSNERFSARGNGAQ